MAATATDLATSAVVSALPVAHEATAVPTPARRSTLRRAFSQNTWLNASGGLIGLGAFMLMQPFSIDLYSYSFLVLLAGVVGFTIGGKLPK